MDYLVNQIGLVHIKEAPLADFFKVLDSNRIKHSGSLLFFSACLRRSKVVKVERSENELARFALPRRILPFDEVKGSESREPCKRSLLSFAWPRRILPFDEVKGSESRAQSQAIFDSSQRYE